MLRINSRRSSSCPTFRSRGASCTWLADWTLAAVVWCASFAGASFRFFCFAGYYDAIAPSEPSFYNPIPWMPIHVPPPKSERPRRTKSSKTRARWKPDKYFWIFTAGSACFHQSGQWTRVVGQVKTLSICLTCQWTFSWVWLLGLLDQAVLPV